MPATQVEVPGLGTVEFPEGVGQEEMTKAIHGALAEKYPISADDLLPSTVQPGQGSPWSGYGPFGNAAAKAEHMEEARSLNQLAGDLIALPGKAAVAIADIPTRISNIGKKPGDRGYTPTLSERGKIIQFPRLQAQQGATGAVAGVVNLLEGTAEGFLEPENAFVMALMPGSGSIAKAASAVWGAQQAAALPESVREAIAVINDPKATLAQKVEAAGQPVVQSYLAQAMVRHGLKKKPSEWQGPLATGKLLKTPDGAKPPPGGPAPEIPTVPEPTPDPTVAPLTASAVRNLPPFGIRTGGEIEFKAKATKPEGQWESVMTDESLPTELRQLARKANNGSATPEETQTLKAWTDSLVRTEQMGVEEHKPAAPAAPEKGAENATRKEREPEHPGTPQGTALPSEREEVRGGEGEPDRNRGGAVGGATGEEAPEVASQRQSDLAALSEWNKTAPMREKADQTPPGFYGIKAMTDAQVSAMSDAQLASNFKEAIRTMKEVAGKRSSDAAADIAKDAKYRLDAAAMYREALKRGLTERNAVLDKYLGAESEAPKALPAPEVAPATETPATLTPAIQVGGKTFTGENHLAAYENAKENGQPDTTGAVEGFVDQGGNWVTRPEGAAVTGAETKMQPGNLHSSEIPPAMKGEPTEGPTETQYDGKSPKSQPAPPEESPPAPNLTPKEDARLKALSERVEAGENLKGKDKDDYIRLRDKSTQKPPERTEGISAGPGAATPVAEFSPPSIADLIDPSVRTIVGRMPPEQAASTTQPPAENFLRRFASSFTGQGTTTIPQQIKGWLGTISGRTLPKTTLRDRLSGELAGRWVASRAAGGPMGNLFVNDVLTGLPVDPAKFHGALLADNLLSIRDNFRAEAERLHAEAEENGEPEKNDQAEALDEAGDKVNTLLGTENFPFADEAELQAYFRQPEVAEAVKRHRENWEQAIDPLYRTTQNIDPDVELPSRGKYSSARLNLNPIVPGEYEPGTGPRVGGNTGGSSGNISGTLRRKNPFARKAKGTGQTYVLNYAESIANSFAKQLEIASKKAFEDRLVESGNAIIDDPGKPPTLPDGSPTKGYPLIRRGFQNKYIYIRSDLAKEYEIASNVVLSPYQGSMMVGFNRALAQTALAGLTDATVHVENLATAAFQVPGSTGKSLLTDALLSAAGRLDVPITAARAAAKAFPHTHLADMIVKHGPKPLADAINKALLKHMTDMAAIAQMNASRVPHAGSVLGVKALGRGVLKADQVTRMVLNDTFNNLARQGLVKMTETNRREFINQAGNYNLRSQGAWMRLLRQTWLAPFATAGRNFATLGIRAMTLDPGVEASSIKAAAALRAAAAAKWIGSAVLVAGLNYAITGQLMGRKGTKFGSIDTGKDDENGKPLAFDLLAFTGQSRALRTVGARSAIDSARLGLGAADIAGGSARDIANTALGATVGPGPRFAMEALTGYPPAVQVGRASRVSPPGESQLVENVKAAAMQANPIAASINEKMKPGGTWGAAIARQAPRFTLSPGKTADMTEKYPRIVEMAQSREFVDDMIKQARKLPMKDRLAFVNSQVDRLPLQERARARREASRRGVYRYQ